MPLFGPFAAKPQAFHHATERVLFGYAATDPAGWFRDSRLRGQFSPPCPLAGMLRGYCWVGLSRLCVNHRRNTHKK